MPTSCRDKIPCLAKVLWHFIIATCLVLPCLALSAQTPQRTDRGIEKLASRAAARASDRLARAAPVHMLLVPMSGCVLDAQACADFDRALRAALSQRLPAVQFIERAQLQSALQMRGLLAIDSYYPDALQAAAGDAGADLFLTEDLVWESAFYELHVTLSDPLSGKALAKYAIVLKDGTRGPAGQPLLLKDWETGAAFILWNGDKHSAPLFKLPQCDVCPEPPVPVQSLGKHLHGKIGFLATIDERGMPGDIVLIKSLNPALDLQALRVVRDWIFKPALGIDGMPFAARTRIDINYDLN